MTRRIGAVLLLVAAVVVYFAMAPEDGSEQGAQSERASIESQDELNNGLAEGAPQQAVVNGWTTNDYLGLLSSQIEDASAGPQRDERPAALLLLGVAGIALIALTTENRPVSPRGVPSDVHSQGGSGPLDPFTPSSPQVSAVEQTAGQTPPTQAASPSPPQAPRIERPAYRAAPFRSDESQGSE